MATPARGDIIRNRKRRSPFYSTLLRRRAKENSKMEYRVYDGGRDREAAHRIWRETGWLEPGKAEHEEAWTSSLGPAGRSSRTSAAKPNAWSLRAWEKSVIWRRTYRSRALRPFQLRTLTAKSRFEHKMGAAAYWQMRICDLPGCLARTHLPGEEVRFNLKLTDPVEDALGEDAQWRCVAGDYVVTLGLCLERSKAPTTLHLRSRLR